MRLIVFQHGECEHPGIFRQFFKEDGERVVDEKGRHVRTA